MNRKLVKHIIFFITLALLTVAGEAWAQGTDELFVIKKGNHYLSHVKVEGNWVLRDAAAFDTTCLWYSGRNFNVMGTNHNYYFIDDANQFRFLSAPLEANGDLTLSASLPAVYLLNNTDQNYYFYDWDSDAYGRGVARGHQYNGVANATECTACGGTWYESNGQCWEVYWVEYHEDYTPNNAPVKWRLSSASSYNITTDAARFRPVEVTEHPREDTPTEGGLTALTVPATMEWGDAASTLSATITLNPSYTYTYIPAFTEYTFEGGTHYYYSNSDHTTAPGSQNGAASSVTTYAWSISEEGEGFLTLTNANTATPTLEYTTAITDGHKSVTVTLTVTYNDNATQTLTSTVLVKAQCQNPAQASAPVVSYEGVTVSWKATADKYKLEWKKATEEWTAANSVNDLTGTSYTITSFEYGTSYSYRVTAYCGDDYLTPPTTATGNFSTLAEPEAIVCGSVFGGGRMANVTGNTEVVIINADSIGAVYGGNDIAGQVQGANGSTIVLGVNAHTTANPDNYSHLYNGDAASTKVRVGDVYGGGNGYYAYNGSNFVAATPSATTATVANNALVTDVQGISVWKNETGADVTLTLPTIIKTAITMTNDAVKVDSIFGGAKNAFINASANTNGTSINVKGGTAFAVYGGNNYGGAQTDGKHYIKVENTKTNTTNTYPAGIGRDFGIAYLFGGGNKVAGKTTEVEIIGGMCDTVFGGGNAADVSAANIKVECSLASGSGNTFGNTYSNAIQSYEGSTLTIKPSGYDWNGTGIYNVRTLFGGNNRANMAGLPVINLTSGSVGTVYGGGNAGHMLAQTPDDANPTTNPGTGPLAIDFDSPMVGTTKYPIYYGTHVVMNSANMIVDYLYGGCQMSDVKYSTWVEVKNGHVGTVYGGCNVSGDVGSEPRLAYNLCDTDEKYQLVKGGTYVKATGGTVYGDLFAGSNGFYHCNDGVYYIEGHNYTSHNYIGDTIPSHNETHVMVSKDDAANTSALVKGNVYAGGNMAYVGFINETDQSYRFRDFVGFCAVRMDGGTVEGSVYGGGNRASIFGSNEVKVSGGSIGYTSAGVATGGALYGGNDRAGQVAQISNRVLSSDYDMASDDATNLKLLGVKTYVGVTGKPKVFTVYGGGNGAYTDYNSGNYCDPTDKPVQSNTFVDINIDADGGSGTGGYINTVYGGGNGVTVLDRITVFVNILNATANAYDQVGTIFGGNNQGDLDILADIIMLHGQVNTVYGGCNSGAMTGSHDYEGYTDVGSVVQLRNEYQPNGTGSVVVPDAKVTGAVYGGCRMNNVTHNSLVLVEGGNHSTANMFGGCDISGIVGGTSQVVVKNGTHTTTPHNNSTVVANVYGGGNGDYDYQNGTYASLTPPSSVNTQVDIMSGTVNSGVYGGNNAKGNVTEDVVVNVTGGTVGASTSARAHVHGGGYGHETHTSGNVTVNIGATTGGENPTYSGAATINGDIYGGSALGQVSATGSLTQVNFYGGTVNGDVYGGGLGQQGTPAVYDPEDPTVIITPAVDPIAAEVSGNVEVNIHGGTFNDASGVANTNDGDPSNGNTGGGRIFGCNNANGSPRGNVNVNIYATDHGADAAHNLFPNDLENSNNPNNITTVPQLDANAAIQTYAIKSVFGGGNLAAYVPDEVTSGDPHSATVHVYNCNNTIEDIFGGGNAADVGSGTVSTGEITRRTNTYVIVDGGRMHRVIGGGNGEDTNLPAANIFGSANTTVYAGLINEVYGGANIQGSVDAINLDMNHSGACGAEVYGKVFGCANAAHYNRSVTTTIECNVGVIGELYGGSNQANIGTSGQNNADVTLNLYGGNLQKVFAGSKGVAAATGVTPVEANIYGNVTLNLYGGTVLDAFGGSDANGNIAGTITVNVIDKNICHPLDVTNIYGASNLTAYNPDDVTSGVKPVSPVVNVVHIAQTPGIRGNVYGGGNQAPVTANPKVNIGYHHASMSQYMPLDANGDSLYHVPAASRAYITGNVFGGGNEAGVTGDPVVNMREKGTVLTGIYGGCNTNGNVAGDINVNIYGGTMGTSATARMTDGIFGGGKGHLTETTGNVTVTIGEGTAPTIYADIYGGSAFGEVGSTNKLAKVDLKNGTVYGTIFGGGKGQLEDNNTNPVTPAYSATVSGSTEVAVEGGSAKGFSWGAGVNEINAAVFGGCNVNGTVLGNATVSYTGGIIGTDADNTANVYGGGLGENTKVKGNVAVAVNNATGDVYGDVYGGSAKGKVNTENGTAQSGYSKTNVTLTAGTIHGSLYGGGHGLENQLANVYGPVTVNVNGGTVTNVFGCNNLKGAPMDSVVLNVTAGTLDSIFGGGNVAAYTAPTATQEYPNLHNYPEVNISGGNITYKVVGGGNNIANNEGINGNPHINISGGTVCTVNTGLKAGVYGGCNTQGRVTGDITVNITGTNTSQTTIGTLASLQAGNTVSIHGGGYGVGTRTTGDVTVNYGLADETSAHCEYPMLYGDMYGGSALGTVNDDASDVTTVTILNGSVKPTVVDNTQYGGNIYGGGLGDDNHAATVYGEVHVNIGNLDNSDNRIGMASLRGCNVFGCNNKNGSPQRNVFVDVYQTNHTSGDCVDCAAAEFAINTVYGGGNRANYAPEENDIQSPAFSLKTHNYIHACDNTVGTVYGGGRAASADGVVTNVDGGRFEYIFGGGNGQIEPADIGMGGIDLTVCSGHVGYKYLGCDMGGTVLGPMNDLDCTVNPCGDDPLTVDYFFFGANKSTIIGGLIDTIFCSQSMTYQNVYAGSRLATIYGDIYLVVQGGTITNLFGGSQGSVDRPGHVRKYPHLNNPQEMALVPNDAYNDMITYLGLYPDLQGTGGNIYLKLEGGTLTNVYGGNQLYGTVEGNIIVVVDDKELDCPLVIDTLYGGNEKAIYQPVLDNGQPRRSPQVYLKNGKVNYDVYGGSLGDRQGIIANAGRVNCNPYVIIGSTATTDHATVGRNLYGGGSMAEIVGNDTVTLRGNATIGTMANGGNVFGGSRLEDVSGNTYVQIEPTTTIAEITIPTPPAPTLHTLTIQDNSGNNPPSYGTLYVTDSHGTQITSGATVAQGSVFHIRVVANEGYEFYVWGVDGSGYVVQPYQNSSTFIMGTTDATLTANFTSTSTPTSTLTLTANPSAGGTFKVNGLNYSEPVAKPQGFPVTVQAIPADGYAFSGWTIPDGMTLTSGNASTSSITFTMGNAAVSLTANFVPLRNLTLEVDPPGACTITVNNDFYAAPVPIAVGASPAIEANPAAGYEGWSVSWTVTSGDGTVTNITSLTPTFTMGQNDTTLKVTFTNPNSNP